MKALLILNDPPYGTERSFNGLRLAKALQGKGVGVTVFLMADAVACAKAGQQVPQGYYNLELMVKSVAPPWPGRSAGNGSSASTSKAVRPAAPPGYASAH